MKDTLLYALVFILLLCGSFFIGYHKGHGNGPDSAADTVRVVEYHRDTVTLEKPLYVEKRIADTIYVAVADTVRMRDTLYVTLPREEKVYRDSLYMAVVSGYLPSLDRIDIFRTERVVTLTVRERKRWGLGVGIGPGLVISPDGRAHFGVGVAAGVRVDF